MGESDSRSSRGCPGRLGGLRLGLGRGRFGGWPEALSLQQFADGAVDLLWRRRRVAFGEDVNLSDQLVTDTNLPTWFVAVAASLALLGVLRCHDDRMNQVDALRK